jgi:membrane associated rhomboid family serine protease
VNWLDKVQRKVKFKGIKGLMIYIIALNAIVFFLYYLDPTGNAVFKLTMSPYKVLQGEVWRLITFAVIPPTLSPIWLIFTLYFYYLIGTTLEHEWGTFKFNVYYFSGILFTVIGCFITGGSATSVYLNMSLFLAFAFIFPNYQVLLFFILPVKMKYLALLDGAFLLLSVITQPIPGKIAVVASVLNFLIFFGKDLVMLVFNRKQAYSRHHSYAKGVARSITEPIHRCEVCGITEKDDKNMEFRYCVECEGDHEYCMEHLTNHVHVKDSDVT